MAFTLVPAYPAGIISFGGRLQNSDSTNKITLYTAGANGAQLSRLVATSTDNALSHYLSLYRTISGVDYLIGAPFVVTLSGVSNAATDLIGGSYLQNFTYDFSGTKIIQLAPGEILKAALQVAMTSGKEINIAGAGVTF